MSESPGCPHPVWPAFMLLMLLLSGCAAPLRHDPLPQEFAETAHIPGIPAARYWGDRKPQGFDAWLQLSDEDLRERYGGIMHRRHDYLLISGGGGNGAFGAGLLNGWSAAGTRPEFQIVTGISTGALIAPFAFLGPAYDARLREMYTSHGTEDLIEPRNIVQIPWGDSVVSTAPLQRLMERYIDDPVVLALAAEYRKGRSLLIGTTNIDAARPVVWDITRIAASGRPDAKRLIHQVILASASIPGVFPPVRIEVAVGNLRYEELHVDGGVTSQLFLSPKGIDWRRIAQRLHVDGEPQLYIIRNAKLTAQWITVQPRLAPIMMRTIQSMIRTQGIGDLAQIYIAAQGDGLGFHLAYIQDDFAESATRIFDRAYMQKLFDYGYRQARNGYSWVRVGTTVSEHDHLPAAATRDDLGAVEALSRNDRRSRAAR
jgi:hypothetical protein